MAENGRVETLAGSSQAGSEDGAFSDARFRNPSGLALDDRGRLWVTDTGNHTIRRLDLVTGMVTTIAGSPGQPGSEDGVTGSARFREPTGIALMPEPLASQLNRNRLGLQASSGSSHRL